MCYYGSPGWRAGSVAFYLNAPRVKCVPQRRARSDAELGEGAVQVRADGTVRQEQEAADLFVAQAGGRELGDLEFPQRQRP